MSRFRGRTLRVSLRCQKCGRTLRRYAHYERLCPCGGRVNPASYEQFVRLWMVSQRRTTPEVVELELDETGRYQRRGS